jgi:hypothetical protein
MLNQTLPQTKLKNPLAEFGFELITYESLGGRIYNSATLYPFLSHLNNP